jgi:hypothetical protein
MRRGQNSRYRRNPGINELGEDRINPIGVPVDRRQAQSGRELLMHGRHYNVQRGHTFSHTFENCRKWGFILSGPSVATFVPFASGLECESAAPPRRVAFALVRAISTPCPCRFPNAEQMEVQVEGTAA